MVPLLNIILLIILVILCCVLLWRLFYANHKISGGITISEFNSLGICNTISHLDAYLLTTDELIRRLNVFNTYQIPRKNPSYDADLAALAEAMVDPKRCEKLYQPVAGIRTSGSKHTTLYQIIDFYKNVAIVMSFYIKRRVPDNAVYKAAQKLMFVINNIDVVCTKDFYDPEHHAYYTIDDRDINPRVNYKFFVRDVIRELPKGLNRPMEPAESRYITTEIVLPYGAVVSMAAPNSEYTVPARTRTVDVRNMKFVVPTAYMVFIHKHTMLYDVLKQTLVDDERRFRCEWKNIRDYIRLADRKENGMFDVKGDYTETYDLNDLNASVFMLSCLHNAGFTIYHYATNGAMSTLNVPTPEITFDTIDYYSIKSKDLQLYRKTRTAFLWANMQHYRHMYKQCDSLAIQREYMPELKTKILKRYQQVNAALYDLWNPDSLNMPLLNNQFTQSFTWKQVQYRAFGKYPLVDQYTQWIEEQAKMLTIEQQFECPYTTYFDDKVVEWLKGCDITGNFDALTIPFTVVPRPQQPRQFTRAQIPTDTYAYMWGNRKSPIPLPPSEMPDPNKPDLPLPPPPPITTTPPLPDHPPPPIPVMRDGSTQGSSEPSTQGSNESLTESSTDSLTQSDEEPERLPTPPPFYDDDMPRLQL